RRVLFRSGNKKTEVSLGCGELHGFIEVLGHSPVARASAPRAPVQRLPGDLSRHLTLLLLSLGLSLALLECLLSPLGMDRSGPVGKFQVLHLRFISDFQNALLHGLPLRIAEGWEAKALPVSICLTPDLLQPLLQAHVLNLLDRALE